MVTWEAKWKAAVSFCHPNHPEQVKLAAEFAEDRDELDTINLASDNHRRQDAHTSNLDKQGTWVKREGRTEKPLAYKPQLRQYIHINPDNTINPDQDTVANGTSTLGPVTNSVSKEGPLVNIYNDEGKVMGTITQNRVAILHSAYCHTRQAAPEILRELHATILFMKLPSSH